MQVVSSESIQQQARAYFGVITRIGLDAWASFRGRVLLTLLLNLAGITAAAGGVGGIYLVVRQLDTGQPLSVGGLVLDFQTQPALMVGLVAFLAVLGVASAACLYYTEWLIAKTAIAYQSLTTERILRVTIDPAYRGWPSLLPSSARRQLRRLLAANARIVALSFRRILQSILPLGTLLIAAIALFIQEFWLTLLLTPVMLGYLVPVSALNRKTALLQKMFRLSHQTARDQIGQIVQKLTDRRMEVEERLSRLREFSTSPEQEEAGRLYFRRRLVTDRIQLINTSFFLLNLLVLFAFFAITTEGTARSWTDLVLYLVALRFAFGALRQVSGAFVLLSRFHPDTSELFQFLMGTEALRARRGALHPIAVGESLRLSWSRDLRFVDTEEDLELSPGQWVWILGDIGKDTLDLEGLVATIESQTLPPTDLLSTASLHTLDEVVPDEEETQGQAQIAVMTARFVKELGPDRILSRLGPDSDTLTFVCTDDPSWCVRPALEPLHRHCAGGLLVAGGQIVAGGSLAWVQAHLGEIQGILGLDDQAPGTDDLMDDEDEEL